MKFWPILPCLMLIIILGFGRTNTRNVIPFSSSANFSEIVNFEAGNEVSEVDVLMMKGLCLSTFCDILTLMMGRDFANQSCGSLFEGIALDIRRIDSSGIRSTLAEYHFVTRYIAYEAISSIQSNKIDNEFVDFARTRVGDISTELISRPSQKPYEVFQFISGARSVLYAILLDEWCDRRVRGDGWRLHKPIVLDPYRESSLLVDSFRQALFDRPEQERIDLQILLNRFDPLFDMYWSALFERKYLIELERNTYSEVICNNSENIRSYKRELSHVMLATLKTGYMRSKYDVLLDSNSVFESFILKSDSVNLMTALLLLECNLVIISGYPEKEWIEFHGNMIEFYSNHMCLCDIQENTD